METIEVNKNVLGSSYRYEKIRYRVYQFGMVFILSCTLVLISEFFLALISPGNQVLFSINLYGEMPIEAVMVVFGIPFFLFIFVDFKRTILPRIKKGEV
jgi:hypothetical protein